MHFDPVARRRTKYRPSDWRKTIEQQQQQQHWWWRCSHAGRRWWRTTPFPWEVAGRMAGLCRCCIRSDTHAHQEVIILYWCWGCYKFQHLASSDSGDECLHLESLLRSGWIGPLLLTHSCSSSTDIDVTGPSSCIHASCPSSTSHPVRRLVKQSTQALFLLVWSVRPASWTKTERNQKALNNLATLPLYFTL